MRMRTRTAGLLAAALVALGGAGCGGDDVDVPELPEDIPTEEIPTEVPELPDPDDDQ